MVHRSLRIQGTNRLALPPHPPDLGGRRDLLAGDARRRTGHLPDSLIPRQVTSISDIATPGSATKNLADPQGTRGIVEGLEARAKRDIILPDWPRRYQSRRDCAPSARSPRPPRAPRRERTVGFESAWRDGVHRPQWPAASPGGRESPRIELRARVRFKSLLLRSQTSGSWAVDPVKALRPRPLPPLRDDDCEIGAAAPCGTGIGCLHGSL